MTDDSPCLTQRERKENVLKNCNVLKTVTLAGTGLKANLFNTASLSTHDSDIPHYLLMY